nr:hypothetical protein [Micromonospora sp. MP36]
MAADEHTTLEQFLDLHRHRVLAVLEGTSDADAVAGDLLSGLADEHGAVRAVVEVAMPALDSVLEKHDGLLRTADLALKCGDLRPDDRLRRRLRRRHGRCDFRQGKPHSPQLQHSARLFQSIFVVDAVTVAIPTHGQDADLLPMSQHVSLYSEFCGRRSYCLHHTRLAFMST